MAQRISTDFGLIVSSLFNTIKEWSLTPKDRQWVWGMTADYSGFDDGKSKSEIKILGDEVKSPDFSGNFMVNRTED